MLSRIASRSGTFGPIIFRTTASKHVSPITAVRTSSSSNDLTVDQHIENWDKANKTYYGPERDTKNFPILRQAADRPPTRMLIFPESWFTFFYDKTGVTGPYMFGTGLITFLMSKELWVVEHGWSHFVAWWALMGVLCKKYGPTATAWMDKQSETYRERFWDEPIRSAKGKTTETMAGAQACIESIGANKVIFQSKRENVDFQLEATYRSRLAEAHQAVKRRLDYQVELDSRKRQFEQRHMVNWIVEGVLKGITPQQEKDSITKCLVDLKALSAKAQPAV